MLGRCIQECYDGPTGRRYSPEGGEGVYPDGSRKKDGMYDVDPLSPIAQYFEFAPGTVKYDKVLGSKKVGKDPVERTVKVGEEEVTDDAAKDKPKDAPKVEVKK